MKTSCIYHNSQLITNFCREKHCLMPLCPQCISEHSLYHEQQRTRPQYTTIHEILADVHVQVDNAIELLEQDKIRNAGVIVGIQTVGDLIRQKISAAKQLVYQAIDQSFGLLQKDLNKMMRQTHEERGVYCLDKSHKQDRFLLEHLDELNSMKNNLKGEKGLSNIIHFFREKISEIDEFHSQFSHYLHVNETYKPTIEINTESIYSLDAIISRVLLVGGKTKNTSSLKKQNQILSVQDKKNKASRLTPAKNQNSQSKIMHPTAVRLKQKNYVPFVQSELRSYSPHISRDRIRSDNLGSNSKIDGQYEKISRKVAIIRQQNERLSRALARN